MHKGTWDALRNAREIIIHENENTSEEIPYQSFPAGEDVIMHSRFPP